MASTARPESLPSSTADDISLKQTNRRYELLGYALMVCAALAYTIHNVLIRYAESKHGVPAASSVMIRAPIQTMLSAIWLSSAYPRVTLSGATPRHFGLLLLRGLLGGTALLLLYIAFDRLPVGDATAIFFCTPIFTLAITRATLGERMTLVDIIAAILSISGVILMKHSPQLSSDSPVDHDTSTRLVGLLAALSSAALTASAYTVVRALGNAVHFMAYVLSMGVCAGFIAVVFFPGHHRILESSANSTNSLIESSSNSIFFNHHLPPLIIASLAGFAAQACTNRSLQLCKAGPATLVRNIEVPLTYAVGAFTLAEKPSTRTIAGATLVVSAAMIIGVARLIKK